MGAWTVDKLRILELYLPVYLQATGRALERIYIDAFAGPGTNRLPDGQVIPGSPLIALRARSRSGRSFSHLYFIEADAAVADELRETLSQESESADRVTVLTGDVNDRLAEVVRRGHPRAPQFVFLDTASVDPAWSTIEAIAPWRVELLVNFPLGMAINRNPSSPKTTAYFGTDEWRSFWNRRDYRGVRDLYKRRLEEIGFVVQQPHDRLIRTEGTAGQHLYYLIPVSKHVAAGRIWRWVLDQPDSRGQSNFFRNLQ